MKSERCPRIFTPDKGCEGSGEEKWKNSQVEVCGKWKEDRDSDGSVQHPCRRKTYL